MSICNFKMIKVSFSHTMSTRKLYSFEIAYSKLNTLVTLLHFVVDHYPLNCATKTKYCSTSNIENFLDCAWCVVYHINLRFLRRKKLKSVPIILLSLKTTTVSILLIMRRLLLLHAFLSI